jgi:hypothetical protein
MLYTASHLWPFLVLAFILGGMVGWNVRTGEPN